MDIIQELKRDGVSKGLCRLWQRKLKAETNVAGLSMLFIKGIDFCISENYPTLDYLRTNFRGKCELYGIFIDDYINETNKPDVVANGACTGILEYDNYSVSRVFTRHNSNLNINASDFAIVTIDAFDDSLTEINTLNFRGKIFVNLYGNAAVKTNGNNIKVKKHNKQTY